MKKGLYLLILLTMVLTMVVGCKKTTDDSYSSDEIQVSETTTEPAIIETTTEPSIETTTEVAVQPNASVINEADLMGSITGEVYTNPYFGFTMNNPSVWTDVREMTAKTYEQQGIAYSTPLLVIASVDPETNPEALGIVSIEAIEKKLFVYPIKDVNEYYTFIKEQMIAMSSDDVEVVVTEPVVTQHTKTNVVTFKVSLNVKSEELTQTILYVIGETDEYFLLGNFMYTDEVDRSAVESIYQSIIFE